jgi:TonB family protein
MGSGPNRGIRLAVELSLLLHLLMLWLLPRSAALFAALLPASVVAVEPEKSDETPIRFELVDLPNQKEETPTSRDAPGSDLSRRAHGGRGEPDTRPGSTGSTYELRLAPGAQAQVPPAVAAPPQQRRQHPSQEQEAERLEPNNDGAATVLKPAPEEPEAKPRPLLQGLSPMQAPSTIAGVAPDRTGGQVDLGPLSFDTQWYDWGPYAAEMLRRIRYHWSIPELAKLGVPGVVRIHFNIERDGKVTGLSIDKGSDHPPMDFAARDAILDASPLPPLPADLTGVDREGVTITFYYNVRPPDDRR